MNKILWNNGRIQTEIDAERQAMKVRLKNAEWNIGLLDNIRICSNQELAASPSMQKFEVPWNKTKPIILAEKQGLNYLYLVLKSGPSIFGVSVSIEREDMMMFGVIPHPQEGVGSEPKLVEWPGRIWPSRYRASERLYIPYSQGFQFSPKMTDSCKPLTLISPSNLSLPFWGVTHGPEEPANGFLAVIETENDCVLEMSKEQNEPIRVRPIWRSSLGRLRYARRLSVQFFERTDGSDLAKKYRKRVLYGPTWYSLQDKIKDRPMVKRLVGAPYVFTGYFKLRKDKPKWTLRLVEKLQKVGYRNIFIGPLDVDIYNETQIPGKPAFINEQAAMSALIQKGCIPSYWLLDRQIDVRDPAYSPKILVRDMNGKRVCGWETGFQKYFDISPEAVDAFHEIYNAEHREFSAVSFDTAAMADLAENWSEDHYTDRAHDKLARIEHWKRYLARDVVIASEAGMGWTVPYCDILSLNNFGHHIANSFSGWDPIPFPLFSLVYRECVMSVWHEADNYHITHNPFTAKVMPTWKDKFLYDLSIGTPPTLAPQIRMFKLYRGKPNSKKIEYYETSISNKFNFNICAQSLPAAQLHQRTFGKELANFQYIDSECRLSISSFSNGVSVFINRDCKAHRFNRQTVRSMSYKIV
jgi:hypothetical protein